MSRGPTIEDAKPGSLGTEETASTAPAASSPGFSSNGPSHWSSAPSTVRAESSSVVLPPKDIGDAIVPAAEFDLTTRDALPSVLGNVNLSKIKKIKGEPQITIVGEEEYSKNLEIASSVESSNVEKLSNVDTLKSLNKTFSQLSQALKDAGSHEASSLAADAAAHIKEALNHEISSTDWKAWFIKSIRSKAYEKRNEAMDEVRAVCAKLANNHGLWVDLYGKYSSRIGGVRPVEAYVDVSMDGMLNRACIAPMEGEVKTTFGAITDPATKLVIVNRHMAFPSTISSTLANEFATVHLANNGITNDDWQVMAVQMLGGYKNRTVPGLTPLPKLPDFLDERARDELADLVPRNKTFAIELHSDNWSCLVNSARAKRLLSFGISKEGAERAGMPNPVRFGYGLTSALAYETFASRMRELGKEQELNKHLDEIAELYSRAKTSAGKKIIAQFLNRSSKSDLTELPKELKAIDVVEAKVFAMADRQTFTNIKEMVSTASDHWEGQLKSKARKASNRGSF